MYLVDFVAVEPRTGEVTLDLDGVDTKEDAQALALTAIERMYPTYEDVQVIGMREVNG